MLKLKFYAFASACDGVTLWRKCRLLRYERHGHVQRGQQQRERLPGRGLPRVGGRGAQGQDGPHRHPARRC